MKGPVVGKSPHDVLHQGQAGCAGSAKAYPPAPLGPSPPPGTVPGNASAFQRMLQGSNSTTSPALPSRNPGTTEPLNPQPAHANPSLQATYTLLWNISMKCEMILSEVATARDTLNRLGEHLHCVPLVPPAGVAHLQQAHFLAQQVRVKEDYKVPGGSGTTDGACADAAVAASSASGH